MVWETLGIPFVKTVTCALPGTKLLTGREVKTVFDQAEAGSESR